ncbi:MAG: PEP-utilizing enzyme [bacterium]|nr:PEP-utilizing enzyme [bacterium]
MEKYFFTTKFKKMGKWALLPADLDNWHGEPTARYFKKMFGFGKRILNFVTFYDGGFEHAYFPESYFEKMYDFIRISTAKNYRFLERKLKKFYHHKEQLKENVPKLTIQEVAKLSNKQLVKFYKRNRDWVHRATVYDQFGWIAEGYWNPIMRKILVEKLKIQPDSLEYHQVLFTLVKPEEISTTLKEKRAVLGEVLKIKQERKTLVASSKQLSKFYGWMSVSAYGEPWGETHYQKELMELQKFSLSKLKEEYEELKNYTKIRNKDIAKIVQKYHLAPRDLQIFIDFGFVLDTRNEAEYLVSYCGYYILPFYQEISRRLALSIRQLRTLYEDEIVAALEGKLNYNDVLYQRRRICGYGFDKTMTKRIYFTPEEAEKLFKHIEKNVQYVNQSGDERKGLCASPGKVRGVAKIVMVPQQDNKKVEKGDIMIAVATMVDHLPAMKNAAAIVTEVGSLTCHAAVVSREFGIPCVVAFKNATKIFKDGDLVEVDANKGTVKILK